MRRSENKPLTFRRRAKAGNVFDIEYQLDRSLTKFLRFACLVQQEPHAAVCRDQFRDPVRGRVKNGKPEVTCVERRAAVHISDIKNHPGQRRQNSDLILFSRTEFALGESNGRFR